MDDFFSSEVKPKLSDVVGIGDFSFLLFGVEVLLSWKMYEVHVWWCCRLLRLFLRGGYFLVMISRGIFKHTFTYCKLSVIQ